MWWEARLVPAYRLSGGERGRPNGLPSSFAPGGPRSYCFRET